MIYRQKSLDADGHTDTRTDRVAHRVALQLMLAARLKSNKTVSKLPKDEYDFVFLKMFDMYCS